MKKFLAIVLSAVLFGGVAGGTMVGVNKLAEAGGAAAAEITAEVPSGRLALFGFGKSDKEETAEEKANEAETEAAEAADAAAAEAEDEAANAAGAQEDSKPTYGIRLDVSDIVEDAMPQVVSITNTMVIKQAGYGSLFDYFYGNGYMEEYEVPAAGSGVILDKTDKELLIVTNNHVVEDSKELSVTFIDGETVTAAIKGTDSVRDLAVIAVPLESIPEETMNAIKIARLHTDEDLKPGQGVIAIGNALGFGETVTVGYISALDRQIRAEGSTYTDLIQVDAAINPGNSGGALLNMDGEVIGINVAKSSSVSIEGVGYSIPIYKVSEVLNELSNAKTKVEVEEENRGRLGIYMNTVTDANAAALGIPAGVIITGFSSEEYEGVDPAYVQESPAEKAGLLKNDIITAFDGQRVKEAVELQQLVRYYEAGSEVKVTVQRLEGGEYQEKVIQVILGNANDESIASDEVKEAFANANGGRGDEGRKPAYGRPQPKDSRNGQQGRDKEKDVKESKEAQETAPEETGNADGGAAESESGSDAADGGAQENGGAQDGGNMPEQGGREGSFGEIYDLFRQFMEQYY